MERKPYIINILLKYDVILTRVLVDILVKYFPFRILKVYSKLLETSCHGITWLAVCLGFAWLIDNKDLYQMQINLLVGLIFDIVLVAIIKAAIRRRRPVENDDLFSYGPDKFSFPSGHTSRAFFISIFFIYLNPVPKILWTPILVWAWSVALSRLILQRHYLLDICAGILTGVLEGYLLSLFWINSNVALILMKCISSDYVINGSE